MTFRLTLTALVLLMATTLARADVALRPGVPILLGESEPSPIRRAARDLQRDLRKVLGADSPVVTTAPKTGGFLVVSARSASTKAFRDAKLTGREAHAIFTRPRAVVLQGADTRGAIYAIYEFADRFLDVPPLWKWASWTPERKTQIRVATDTNVRFESPAVPYRTWFPNDQDMHDKWERLSGENYDAMFETLLRLKFNTLDVDYISDLAPTAVAPATPGLPARADANISSKISQGLGWARTCRERGIVVTTTHIAPFGARWLKSWKPYWEQVRKVEAPALLLTNEEKFDEWWTYHIELCRREKLEMLWQIAFRGDNDKKLGDTFADAPASEVDQAKIVERMLQRQVALLRKVTGEANPPMRATMFEEVSRHFSRGLLSPPDAPSLIWQFGNDVYTATPYPGALAFAPNATRPIGLYSNLQYTAVGSHLVPSQSPRKLQQNLKIMRLGSGLLQDVMLNVGNLREFVYTIDAGGRILWNPAEFDPDRFAREFSARYYGAEHAGEVAALYDELYAASWETRAPTSAPVERQHLFQDLKTARFTEAVLDNLEKGVFDANPIKTNYFTGNLDPKFQNRGDGSQLGAIVVGNQEMFARLRPLVERAELLKAKLPPARRAFFDDQITLPARFLLHSNESLSALIRAENGKSEAERAALQKAHRAASAAFDALKAQDRGEFATWHDHAGRWGYRAREYRDRISARLKVAAPVAESGLR